MREVTAALEASKQQINVLQAAAKAIQQASTDQASRQVSVLSIDQSAAESVQSEQLSRQAEADSAEISQLHQQVRDESTKVSQLQSHAEHLCKKRRHKSTQYSQLLKQHQVLQAMAAEASQEGDQQEEDLRQKDAVIQQLQQQLVAAQQILAEGTEGPAPAHGTWEGPAPLAPAVSTGSRPPTQQASQSATRSLFSPPSDPNLTPTSTNRGNSQKQQGLHSLPINRSLQTTRAITAPATSTAQPAATAVSARAVPSSSLSMPEGSVDNPLAGQPDLDDHDDQISSSKLRPLSPQLSGLISDSDSGTDSGTDDEGTAGHTVRQHTRDQQVSSTPPPAFASAADRQQQSMAAQDAWPQEVQQVGSTLFLHRSHVHNSQSLC